MRQTWQRILALTGMALLSGGTDVVRADLFRDVGRVLDIAGFDVRGQNNPYSGGVDAFIGRSFFNSSQDFGVWDLTLDGPVAMELTTGGRLLRQVDFSFSTSFGNGAIAQPFSYTLAADSGAAATLIEGTILLDATFSINALGYYDVGLRVSSRQDVTQEGLFAGEPQENDFDIGPINVSGNIFADLLAMVTKPIFDASGTTNPFESFAESVRFKSAGDAATESALASLAMGNASRAVDDRAAVIASFLGTAVGLPGVDFAAAGARAGSPGPNGGGIVPEPTVALLLLLGMPYVLRRKSLTG